MSEIRYCVNIWDEPDNNDEYFAYVEESDLADDIKKEILLETASLIPKFNPNLSLEVIFYRVKDEFPDFPNEYVKFAYERYQLQIGNLDVDNDENLALANWLNTQEHTYNGIPIYYISES